MSIIRKPATSGGVFGDFEMAVKPRIAILSTTFLFCKLTITLKLLQLKISKSNFEDLQKYFIKAGYTFALGTTQGCYTISCWESGWHLESRQQDKLKIPASLGNEYDNNADAALNGCTF